MDAFYERLIVRAATIDELLSGDFEPLPGQKEDADLAARRLAAWCRSCASGDWSLFGRRLDRDGLTLGEVLTRFATVRRKASAPVPAWVADAIWIEAALQRPTADGKPLVALAPGEPCAFEHLFTPVIAQAEELLWTGIGAGAFGNLNESARAGLRHSLLKGLSGLCAAALYERFDKARKAGAPSPAAANAPHGAGARYEEFVAAMKAGGFRRLFEDKPVLLRLIAALTRQWIDASRELVLRLDADLAAIRRDILRSANRSRVAGIEGDLSDPHNGGRSVQIVRFEDGSRIVYKPKDLRLDAAWHDLIARLNRAAAPVALNAMGVIARDGYGWTEFLDHAAGTDREGCDRFFRRAGAWLALFHCFAATDMHQENMIAAGDHPVPIDLEMILQATAEERKAQDAEGQAFDAASEVIANSVLTVGLLPAYGRSADNNIFAVGAMTSDQSAKIKLKWNDINSDKMRPVKAKEAVGASANLPHVGGNYATFGDHVGGFLAGFAAYGTFLQRQTKGPTKNPSLGGLFDGFAGLPVRKVIRPTQFYYLLLQRLRDHRSMEDGVIWSAQADFVARLADWEKDADPTWPLQRAERAALVALNVPHFVSPSDASSIEDASGAAVQTKATPGIARARDRVESFDEKDIAWQIDVIRHSTSALLRSAPTPSLVPQLQETFRPDPAGVPAAEIFAAEADRIAAELNRHAIRRGPGAAWIGLDWLGDSEVFQLVCLGPDLYNGVSGISLFLAAHAAVTRCGPSAELAFAAVAHLRKTLRSRNAPRIARSLGIGGAAGLGSIVYALTAMAKCLDDDGLLADAHVAAELFTAELIGADKRLDVVAGSAGAILGLLRLYRDTHSADVLERATKCGEHLLRQSRVGAQGRRSWVGHGFGPRALNGMSHGAAGFAYALALLSAATGREDFAQAAAECIAFENSSYDPNRNNWPDLRGGGEPSWLCQWCYGAPGIGLARIAASKRGAIAGNAVAADISNAVDGAQRGWPSAVDTLCCGTLGSVEFFCEAAGALGRGELRELASQRLMAVLQAARSAGDYRWNSGTGQFNLGLFRGLAGVGYTLLRRLDGSLPNVLLWE